MSSVTNEYSLCGVEAIFLKIFEFPFNFSESMPGKVLGYMFT